MGKVSVVKNDVEGKEPVRFNYKSKPSKVSANDIPTLLPEKLLNFIMPDKDGSPFVKVESIDYPVKGDGGIYVENFFKSFVNVTKDRPIPGDKRGHSFFGRGNSDFFVIGGRVDSNGDGTGTAYLKIYVPPTGEQSDNAAFIRDMNTGIVNFSLVTRPIYDIDKNGQRNIKQTAGSERNDAVDFGGGAMDQLINANSTDQIISETQDRVEQLIKAGKVDRNSRWAGLTQQDEEKLLGPNGDNWEAFKRVHLVEHTNKPEKTKGRYGYPVIKNGIVFWSALRSVESRATQNGLDNLAAWAKAQMDKIKQKGKGNALDKEEILREVKEAVQNGVITPSELAMASGSDSQFAKYVNAVNDVEKLKNMGLTDPVAQVQAMIDDRKTGAKERINSKIKDAFGPADIQVGKDTRKNLKRELADSMLANATLETIDADIEKLKSNSVMQNLAKQEADYTKQNSGKIVEQAGGGESQQAFNASQY